MSDETKHPVLRDPLAGMLGHELRRASLVTFGALADAFEPLGLRLTEAVVIRYVEANPGCNQAEISRSLGVKRTNMVPVINGLVLAGMIDRSAADGRTHALVLTSKGQELHAQIVRTSDEHEDYFFGGFDEKTRRVLHDALKAIRAKAPQ